MRHSHRSLVTTWLSIIAWPRLPAQILVTCYSCRITENATISATRNIHRIQNRVINQYQLRKQFLVNKVVKLWNICCLMKWYQLAVSVALTDTPSWVLEQHYSQRLMSLLTGLTNGWKTQYKELQSYVIPSSSANMNLQK